MTYESGIINPGAHAQRAWSVCLSVCQCLCVCVRRSILAPRAITRQTSDFSVTWAAKLKRCFVKKCFVRKLERYLLTIRSAILSHVHSHVYAVYVCHAQEHVARSEAVPPMNRKSYSMRILFARYNRVHAAFSLRIHAGI